MSDGRNMYQRLEELGGFSKFILMGGPQAKIWLKQVSPNRYKLYAAGWRSGFTVNAYKATD